MNTYFKVPIENIVDRIPPLVWLCLLFRPVMIVEDKSEHDVDYTIYMKEFMGKFYIIKEELL